MNSDTQSITIHARPAAVFDFIASAENLPRWAVGFAKSVRRDADAWVVSGAGFEMPLRIEARADVRVVDFRFTPPPGSEALAATRVLPNGDASQVLFTQFQGAGMNDDDFARSVAAVKHELTVLRALLEVECPL